jgi:Cof subfamily protein (haloacid dehalogenase superfamily)
VVALMGYHVPRELTMPDAINTSPPPAAGRRIAAEAGPIRMIAIDLDGTLLNRSKQVTAQTVAGLGCARAAGIKIIIASARPPRAVRHIYKLLELDTLQINYNGALIWDELKQQGTDHLPLAGDLARAMVRLAREKFPQTLVTCELMDRWLTDRAEQTYMTETGKMFKPDVIAPLDTFLDKPVTKLMLLGEPASIRELETMLIERFKDQAVILRIDDDLIQIMDRRVSKAAALRKLAKRYGISAAEVMAIGDAPNDVGMLKLAGTAVAMDNAHPLVKQAAHWVAPSNDDHGVWAALRHYGLCT